MILLLLNTYLKKSLLFLLLKKFIIFIIKKLINLL